MRSAIFSQIGLDSGALGLLGSVVHSFEEPGHHVGTALDEDDARREFEVVVSVAGLVVRYIRPSKDRYSPPDPVRVTVGHRASRKGLRVGAGQGITFEATEGARTIIEMVELDDGPATKPDRGAVGQEEAG